MCKPDGINIQRITTSPEEDRTTAMNNRHEKFGEDRKCSSVDTIMVRQTHRQTDRHAHHNAPRSLSGAE